MPAKIVSFQNDPWNKSSMEDHDGIEGKKRKIDV